MTLLLLLVALLTLAAWYGWCRYAPLLKFPGYFWISFEVFHWVFLAKKREPFGRYIFLKMVQVCKKYEDEGMVLVWLLPPVLFVFGEESVKFFSSEQTMIRKPYFYEYLLGSYETTSIIASGGEKWKKERRMIAPAFKKSLLREMAPAMNRHGAALARDLARVGCETTDNTSEWVKTRTISLIYDTAMGIKQESEGTHEKARELMELTERLLELISLRVARPWLHLDFVWEMSPHFQKSTEVYDDIRRLISNVITQLKKREVLNSTKEYESEESSGRNCKTFSEALLEMHQLDPSFTIAELIGQLFTIIGASFHTSSNTLTWIFWLLGLHPDVQERAYEEVVSETGPFVTFDDARRLSYLECVIKESLRLYPLIPMYGRTSDRDIHYGKYRIPKGTPVVLVPYVLHRNPEVYPDPDTFLPDRFRDTTSDQSPWTLLPFAEGTRSCIGKNYAMLQMKIFLSHVLKKFKIVSSGRMEDVLLSWEVLLKPMTPLRMKFVLR